MKKYLTCVFGFSFNTFHAVNIAQCMPALTCCSGKAVVESAQSPLPPKVPNTPKVKVDKKRLDKACKILINISFEDKKLVQNVSKFKMNLELMFSSHRDKEVQKYMVKKLLTEYSADIANMYVAKSGDNPDVALDEAYDKTAKEILKSCKLLNIKYLVSGIDQFKEEGQPKEEGNVIVYAREKQKTGLLAFIASYSKSKPSGGEESAEGDDEDDSEDE